jgi:hypothetical protein
MWLTEKMRDLTKQSPAGKVADVIGDESFQTDSEYRNVAQVGPWGILWKAPVSAQTILVDTNLGKTSIGAVQSKKALEPGELLLFSQGGAEIYLKNNGEIVLNGQVFAAKKE